MNVVDRIKALVKQEQIAESDWQSYITLSILQSIPHVVVDGAERHPLLSAEALAANRLELNRLRRKFWDDDRSLAIDPARPKSLSEIPEATEPAKA
jgi:hypothetical protein